MKDIEVKIKSWRDCHIDTYFEIVDVLEQEDLSAAEKDIKILSILCDVDEDTIWSMDISKAKELISQAAWVNNFDFDQNAKYKKLILNGQTYTIDTNLEHFTTAQYIDFQTFWAKKDMRNYMGNLLACFVIPKGKKYADGYDVAELANLITSELDIVSAQEILFFSQRRLLTSIQALRTYLMLQMRKMKKKLTKEDYELLEAATLVRWNNIIDGYLA